MEIPRSEQIFRVLLNVALNVVILAGNALVVLAFWRYKSLRSIPHLFILNLAITDLLLGVLVVPFITAAIISEGWSCGEFVCNFQGGMTAVVTVASVFTLTFVSLERKLAICNPWYHYVWFNSRKVTGIFVVIWLICCLLAAIGFLSSKYVFKHQFMMCMIDWNETLWVTVYAVTIHFFLPFLLLVYSNVAILKVLRHRRRIKNSCTSGQQRSQSAQTRRVNREKKAWKLLSTVVLVFVLCWAPYYLSVVCSTLLGNDCAIPKRFGFYFVVCAGANSCVNPVIYVIMNNSFRQAFFRLLHIRVTSSKKRTNSGGDESSHGKRTVAVVNISTKYNEVKSECVNSSGKCIVVKPAAVVQDKSL